MKNKNLILLATVICCVLLGIMTNVARSSDEPFPGEMTIKPDDIIEDMPSMPSGKTGDIVKVYMNDGKMFEGKLLEETDQYIVLEVYGVSVTYYKDDINRIE